MQNYTIDASELKSTLEAILKEEERAIIQKQRKATEEIARETSERLHTAGDFNGTKYRRSWTYKPDKVGSVTVSFTVYNAKHYRLAHLLEDGHKSANQYGHYPDKRANKYPHIKPTYDVMEKKYLEALKEV